MTVLYGLGSGETLDFVVFAEFATPEATTYSNSTGSGSATHDSGVAVQYSASRTGIEINGSSFEYADGRVFVADARTGEVQLEQLDLDRALGAGPLDDELARLAASAEVDARVGD